MNYLLSVKYIGQEINVKGLILVKYPDYMIIPVRIDIGLIIDEWCLMSTHNPQHHESNYRMFLK